MLIMTSSSAILTGEDERRPSEDGTPTHSHRRRWSTPIDSGGESLHDSCTVEINSGHESPKCREHGGVNLDDFFSCSSDNKYSFYLGGEKSQWGASEPPLLTDPRSIAPPRTRNVSGEERRGRSVTRKQDLPPFLTTLDCNGRPRFHHRRVRSEGRLEIASVAVDSPEIVSVRGRGGLRIGTLQLQLLLSCVEMEEEEIGKAARARAKKEVAQGRVIDIYAAQCDKCHKWRVLESQETYEDIRSRMLEEPFRCDQKHASCEEPADIDYDASRTWVMDKPGLPKTPKGFKRSLVLRKDYSKMDTYYITPSGKKLRSRNEVASFVEANPDFSYAPLGDFTFTVPKVMEDTLPPDARLASPPSDKCSSNKPFRG
ncbi:unnamed protein product [Thlaspi arvense]|uniref:Uncharacterized protein n=1 Tax=Thlaspi arvense TaxID=13288 RepID=A0AAU9SBP3_THLAR|nr:unnamed protein product [Thlaspi arvense]